MILWLALLMFTTNLLAHDPPNFYARVMPSAQDVCIVSLGGNCRNSTWLKELNIRFQAFPFDWVESEEIEGIINLLNNDFHDYLSFKNLIPYDHSHYNRIRDNQYKINLVHEFSFQGNSNFTFANEKDLKRGKACLQNEYQVVLEKYKRRIDRFRNLTVNYKTIIFMRTLFVDKPSAMRLYEALVKLFGNTHNIILAVVSDTEEFKEDWGYSKIKNFYLPTPYLIHDGYGQHFGHIIEKILENDLSKPI